MMFEAVFMQPLFHALGWALLHFLWQGALVALMLAGVLMLLREQASNIRYAAACTALVLMLVLVTATFWRISNSSYDAEVDEMTLSSAPPLDVSSAAVRVEDSEGQHGNVYATVSAKQNLLLTKRLDSLLPWLILAWLMGVLGLTVRMLGGLMYTRRLMRCGNRLVGIHWQERLKILSKQLRLTKPVQLLESTMIRVPTTVGWLRPLILLPASTLTGLTPQQLELILAHELAHIRRYDYLINLFQVVVETLLFYHPAVWWVSRQVRIEREHACDDLAVAVCGDPIAYARALTRVERLRQDAAPLLVVAADGGKLSGRIRRLVKVSHNSRRPSFPFMCLLFIAAFFTSIAYMHAVLSHKKQPSKVVDGREASLHYLAPTDEAQKRGASVHALPVDEMAALIARDDTAGEDAEVRRVALDALGLRTGTVIVMNPRTGRVYAVVNQEWAVRRSWKPASMIKLVTGAASVEEKAINPAELIRISANARALDLTEALARSDNSYFSFVGERVGSERLLGYAREMGLGEQTGINYADESAGLLPSSTARSDASRIGAFGEGIEATPIQLATLVSAIANGGMLVTPRVPRTPQESAQFEPQIRRSLRISRETLKRLTSGMIAAIDYGTGKAARDPEQRMAGKTGTFSDNESSVGLFASYAPAHDPQLVVVVLTRGPGESGPQAASVAGTIYRALNRYAL